jgi:hypothetical protein
MCQTVTYGAKSLIGNTRSAKVCPDDRGRPKTPVTADMLVTAPRAWFNARHEVFKFGFQVHAPPFGVHLLDEGLILFETCGREACLVVITDAALVLDHLFYPCVFSSSFGWLLSVRRSGRRCGERVAHAVLEVNPPHIPATEAALPHRVEEEDLEVGGPGWATVIARSIYYRTKI